MKRRFTITFVSSATTRDISAWLDLLDGSSELDMRVQDVGGPRAHTAQPAPAQRVTAPPRIDPAPTHAGDMPSHVRRLAERGHAVTRSSSGWNVEVGGTLYRGSSPAIVLLSKHKEARVRPCRNPRAAGDACTATIDVDATLKELNVSIRDLQSRKLPMDSLELAVLRSARMRANIEAG